MTSRGLARQLFVTLLLGAGLAGSAHSAAAQTLPDRTEKALKAWYRSAHRSAPGTWGIAVADQEGQMLWSVNPNQELVPASTVKLLTTGYARSVLGSDARQSTKVLGYGHLELGSGQWVGRWALELNGDPSLESPSGAGPRLADLATQLAEQGIRTLRGPLQVVSADGEPADASFPKAWSAANWGSLYTPLIGMLTLHENMIVLNVAPASRSGRRAILVETSPKGLNALVDVHATTVAGRRSRLTIRRMADGGYLVNGQVGVGAGIRQLKTVASDPKAVLAAAWAQALEDAGIGWDRTPQPVTFDETQNTVLAEVLSESFDSLASGINRRSLNLGAELLLRWAGGAERGAELLTEYVEQVSKIDGGVHLVDGSGMSHEDRVTPATFIAYMANVQDTPGGHNFPYLLPANGVGTLARLAGGMPQPGVVRAKTGTLNGVSTLVGFLGRKDGMLLVSLMYNGPRSRTAKRSQWQFFRLLGAEGVTITSDSTDMETEGEILGGDPEIGGDPMK